VISSFGFAVFFVIQPTPRLHLSLVLTNLLFRWVDYPGNWTLQRSAVLGSGATWDLADGTVTIKNMRSGEQSTHARTETAALIVK